jgi:pantoate--beta-alanine ligase
MRVGKTMEEIRSLVAEARSSGAGPVGFVPTMGALHEGHYSLIDAASRDCGFVVVSIFVNPTQFAPDEDYQRYPRSFEADLTGCESRGVGAVFTPTADLMYPTGFATKVQVSGVSEPMCGRFRPGHFDGVATIVAKLFNVVRPDVAYFGAKDYQQTAVIERMVADLNMPLRIEVCPTVRESDGLAMSTRNAYLGSDERSQARALVESLRLAQRLVSEGQRGAAEIAREMQRLIAEQAPLGKIDYVEIVDPDSLQDVQTIDRPVVAALAVRFPSARLIDNMRIDPAASSG